MNRSEMESLIEQEVKGLTNYLDGPDYTNACNDAARETGFSFPTSSDFQVQWLKERSKRHLFFYLLTESAHKFKYEQINLQHRFDHYRKIVRDMDWRYDKAKDEFYLEFAGATAINVFGTKIDAGFQYDAVTGRETTYNDDNVTILTPTEND